MMNTSPKSKFHFEVALLITFLVFIGWACYGTVSEAKQTKAAVTTEATPEEMIITEDTAVPEPFMVAQADKPQEKKVSPLLDPNDPSSVLYLDTSGKLAGTGDPTKPVSESFKAGMGWHPKALAAEGLPRDKYGLVDWVRLVDEKLLAPRHSLDPNAQEPPVLNMDVTMKVDIPSVNAVKFPHNTHTYWLSCEVCHPQMFLPKVGENVMNMLGIVEGKWCGRCHGKVAFPLTDCNRCHSEPPQAAK
jgi:c(7)-type cytochrome triheme protein